MFGPTIILYGFDRAEKTAQDKSEKPPQKYAHSVLKNAPRLRQKY